MMTLELAFPARTDRWPGARDGHASRLLRAALVLALGFLSGCSVVPRSWRQPDFKIYHLGTAGQPEWLEFANDPPVGRELSLPFDSEVNETESTLFLWQDNVKYAWKVGLNGKPLGQLALYEIPVLGAFAVPAGLLKKGENLLTITPPKEQEDIQVGMVRLDPRPRSQVITEATLDIEVVEPLAGGGVPCRITIVDESVGALPPLQAAAGQALAVRPGCVYSPDGRARITL